jgi:hypothetical protein
MVCDPVLVLSDTVNVADLAPDAVGVKVTVTRHVPFATMVPELGHVLKVLSLKSPALVPLIAMLLMFSAIVVLVSVRVEDFAALVDPTATVAKLSVAGNKVAVAFAPLLPVPESATVCDKAVVLSETVSVADRAPDAVGLKVTVTRHVA